jgi:hypothetical protein
MKQSIKNMALTLGFLAALATVPINSNAQEPDKKLESKVCETVPARAECTETKFNNYQSQIAEAVCDSHGRNSYALVIDKSANEMDLYVKGELVSTYKVGLGRSAFGDRNHDKDKCTPEGNYKIRNVDDRSTFCKSAPCTWLELDFPDRSDYNRFQKLSRTKKIPQNSKLQSSIYIRSTTAKNAGRTNGNIELNKKDLADLLKQIGSGLDNPREINVLIVPYGARKNYQ